MKEKSELYEKYLAEAEAMNRSYPHAWARQKTIKAIQLRMIELGARRPWSLKRISKHKIP